MREYSKVSWASWQMLGFQTSSPLSKGCSVFFTGLQLCLHWTLISQILLLCVLPLYWVLFTLCGFVSCSTFVSLSQSNTCTMQQNFVMANWTTLHSLLLLSVAILLCVIFEKLAINKIYYKTKTTRWHLKNRWFRSFCL